MADPRTFSNLRNILAQLYPDEASTRRVAHDAGLSATRISFSAIAINTWHTILTEAENVNKVDALLDVVLEEYGDNPALHSTYEAYRRTAPPKDAIPNNFRIQNDFKKGRASDSGSPKTPTKRWLWGIPILVLIAVGLSYGVKLLTDTRPPATSTQLEATPTTVKAASLAATSTPTLTLVSSPIVEPTSTAVPSTSTPRPTNTPTPTVTPTPTNTPTLQAGATRINPKDDAVYVYIPAGEFLMGSRDEDESVLSDEKPQHKVFVNAFWIMQTEVTNAQYKRCLDAGVCIKTANDSRNYTAYADYPVANVNWREAKTYAEWVGGRLPTEAEWEKACRNTNGLIYPWGNQEPSPQRLNFRGSDLGDTTVVGSYPAGAYKLYDMAGNVWEWTSSLYVDYPYHPKDGRENLNTAGNRVLRGASFGYNRAFVRCAYRYSNYPVSREEDIGFRLVFSAP